MWIPGTRRRRLDRDAVAGVVWGCERLLEGSFLDGACAGGGPVPCWAWLNKLTHCPEAELVLIAARPLAFENRPDLHSWGRTVSFLAHELLESAARSGSSPAVLQRQALLPLEVDLAGHVFQPSELTRRVLVAIEETIHHRA